MVESHRSDLLVAWLPQVVVEPVVPVAPASPKEVMPTAGAVFGGGGLAGGGSSRCGMGGPGASCFQWEGLVLLLGPRGGGLLRVQEIQMFSL